MLTIFTIPKSFIGHSSVIQRNAIRSWSLLEPECEIILCGDECGTSEIAAEFDVTYLPNIARNEYGTPLLNSAFGQVAAIAKHNLLCYINADIILLRDFARAIQRIEFPSFLMVGHRWNVNLAEPLDFAADDWEDCLRAYTSTYGVFQQFGWDYFVFARDGKLEQLPPFAVGRPYWDNWFLYHARKLGIPVIDATQSVLSIHQNHDYVHVALVKGDGSRGIEGDQNLQLIKTLNDDAFKILAATHLMMEKGITPVSGTKYLWSRIFALQFSFPAARIPIKYMYHLWRRMFDRPMRRLRNY